MKKLAASFAPWVALMIVGMISTPRMANTTPTPQERHPRIRAAVNELQAAKEELRNAAHDFCGHRVEAIEKTDQALNQLRLALACDRK
jgi:hypothetical protein